MIMFIPFHSQDPEDLPFRKSEVLDVISKDEKDWWTCRNSRGNVGQVPVPYVSKVCYITCINLGCFSCMHYSRMEQK